MSGWLEGVLTQIQEPDARLTYKLVVSSLSMLLCALLWWRARRGVPRRWVSGLLVLLTLLGIGSYFELGWLRYERYLNPHDVYHYYIGAKYSSEHRYLDLYRASLLADIEMNASRQQVPAFHEKSIRDLHERGWESVADVVAEEDTIHQEFGVRRWEEFKEDIRFFEDAVSPYSRSKWGEMLRDKGYNATPVWNAEARAIAARVPTSSPAMRLLPMIDLALLLGMFALVWRAFGATPAALTILFFGVDFAMSYPHIKGGFLRLDWLALTVASGALLRLRRPVLAGAALAGATLSRIFPLIFAFGPGVLLAESLVATLLARRRGQAGPGPRRDLLAFFLALGLVGAGLVGASLLAQDGADLWRIFFRKITQHDHDIASTRTGFKYLWYGLATGLRFDQTSLFNGAHPLYTILSLLPLLPTALVVRRTQSWEALLLGFIPFFFLAAPTFYYDAILVAPLLFCAARMDQGWRAAAAAGLFGVSAAAYAFDFELELANLLCFVLSVGMLATFPLLWMAAWRASEPDPAATTQGWGARWEPAVALGALLALGALMLSAPRSEAGPARPVTVQEAVAPGPGEASLIFVGDIIGARGVEGVVRARQGNWDSLLDPARRWLSEADLTIGNLETPVSQGGSVIAKNYAFRSPPELLPTLARAGFDVLSMANNHVLDYGPTAMEDTARALADNGLRTGGVAKVGEPQTPLIEDVRGLKVGFLFYCDPDTPYACAREFKIFDPRPVEVSEEILRRDIGALRSQVDVLAVVMHWDIENAAGPTRHTRTLARAIIDLGADVVVGSHPHVQFPIERYKSGVILYSLGNFVFDQAARPATRVARVARVVVGKGAVRAVQILPMEIIRDQCTPTPLTPGYIDLSQDSATLRAWPVAPPVAGGAGPG